jgi:hypothetical protein
VFERGNELPWWNIKNWTLKQKKNRDGNFSRSCYESGKRLTR